MLSFLSQGIRLSFIDENQNGFRPFPVLLIHGFASHVEMNWIGPGWVKDLSGQGYRVVAYDNRGHGKSEKVYDPELYSAELMADDACNLLDHLNITKAHVIGYSMGARIAATMALRHAERVGRLVIGGLGLNIVRSMAGTGPISQALMATHIDDVLNPTARTFRAFAEQTKSDLKSLAVCIRKIRAPVSREALVNLTVPVLVAVGTRDVIAGPGAALAQMIPGAEFFEILEYDHMKAVGAPSFKQAVLAFLDKAN